MGIISAITLLVLLAVRYLTVSFLNVFLYSGDYIEMAGLAHDATIAVFYVVISLIMYRLHRMDRVEDSWNWKLVLSGILIMILFDLAYVLVKIVAVELFSAVYSLNVIQVILWCGRAVIFSCAAYGFHRLFASERKTTVS